MRSALAWPGNVSRWRPCTRCPYNYSPPPPPAPPRPLRRLISSSMPMPGDWHLETLNVACGSSGTITVDLHNSPALLNPSNPLILYLPPTGNHLRSHHPQTPPFLSSPSSALARIDYRWNLPPAGPTSSLPHTPPPPKPLSSHPSYAHHAFPTPLHDILHAFEFLMEYLRERYTKLSTSAQPKTQYSSYKSPELVQRPIFVYGDFLGGSLATSLALTESHASHTRPTRIAGLIARNAVLDWSSVATQVSPPLLPPTPSEHSGNWTSNTLHGLRESLFTSPAAAFDNFASPLLLFRTSGLTIPASWPSDTPPTPPASPYRYHDHDDHPMARYGDAALSTSKPANIAAAESLYGIVDERNLYATSYGYKFGKGKQSDLDIDPVSRRSNLKFPPLGSGLRLPKSLFLYGKVARPPQLTKSGKVSRRKITSEDGHASPEAQAVEMVKVMRRSIVMHEMKDRVFRGDGSQDAHAESEERIQTFPLSEYEQADEGQMVRQWIRDSLS